ncbi:MAG TPA: transglutaminase family protein, partial [Acidobacteriaceae bacterium]|nr:transglutaminase family protein [Acidobacteriaceae bacterium]
PTGTAGESVAGIRYRARRLNAALHPTIPVHTPLRFELIDTWKHRSIAHCTYHAAPPDGSLYTARPADAAEARARRLQRFESSIALGPQAAVPADENNPIFPMTLDLRWPAPIELAESHTTGLSSPAEPGEV